MKRSAITRLRVIALLIAIATFGAARYVYAATTLQRTVINASIATLFTNDISPTAGTYEPNISYTTTWADGNAINQGQVVYFADDSVAASATDSHDLAGGKTDAYGNTITCLKLKAFWVENRSSTVGDVLKIARPAGATGVPIFGAVSDYINLPPGGLFLWATPAAAGITVTAASGDIIEVIEAGGVNTVNYRIGFICTDS